MPIKGLTERTRLPRLGKIHLGEKVINATGKEYPRAVDYFVVPPEIQSTLGEYPKTLDIMFPVEDEDQFASQFYRLYNKVTGELLCKGDGEKAVRKYDLATGEIAGSDAKEKVLRDIECPGEECEFYGTRCTEIMNLQFYLPKVWGVGIWQIDTGSINSILNVNSFVRFLKAMVGRCSMIPLQLFLEPKEVMPASGGKMTVYMMNLRYDGTIHNLFKYCDRIQLPGQTKEIILLPTPDDEVPELIIPENQDQEEQVLTPVTPRPPEPIVKEVPPAPPEVPKEAPKTKKEAAPKTKKEAAPRDPLAGLRQNIMNMAEQGLGKGEFANLVKPYMNEKFGTEDILTLEQGQLMQIKQWLGEAVQKLETHLKQQSAPKQEPKQEPLAAQSADPADRIATNNDKKTCLAKVVQILPRLSSEDAVRQFIRDVVKPKSGHNLTIRDLEKILGAAEQESKSMEKKEAEPLQESSDEDVNNFLSENG